MPGGSANSVASDVPKGSARDDEVQVDYALQADELNLEEEKWAPWKVTVFVIAFCGSFWTGVAYLLMRLLG